MDFAKSWNKRKPLSRQSISIGQALRSRYCAPAHHRSLSSMLHWIQCDFWLPTILKNQSGLSDAQVGLLGAVLYVVALFAMLFNGWHSDRNRERQLARCGPTLDRRNRIAVASSTLPSSDANDGGFTVERHLHRQRHSARALGDLQRKSLSDSKAAVAVRERSARSPALAGFAGPHAFGYLSELKPDLSSLDSGC